MTKLKRIRIIAGIILVGVIIYMGFSAFRFTNDIKNSSETMRSKKIIAHRGGADLGPENSLYCINKGIEAGADMVEIDLHLSKDGEIIVCHDPKIDRTTNGKGYISELTFDELRQYRLLDADGKATDQQLPTLDEVMELTNGRCELLIEIKKDKSSLPGIEEKVLQTINRHQAESRSTIQSFNDEVLERFHELDPNIRLEKLFIFKLWGLPVIFDGTFSRFNDRKYDYIQIGRAHV